MILKLRSLSYAIGATVGLLLCQQSPARPDDCEDGRWIESVMDHVEDGQWIESVMDHGRLIRLGDGSLWQVEPKDAAKTSTWRRISNVIICGNRIANEHDNKTARVKRLR
jgi:hypothetical protein